MHRKLIVILGADVAGYSRLIGEDEVATIRTLTAYREVILPNLGKNLHSKKDAPSSTVHPSTSLS